MTARAQNRARCGGGAMTAGAHDRARRGGGPMTAPAVLAAGAAR